MILIQPYWQVLEQEPGIEGMYKQIEYCGRISHKSENSITKDSYVDFVKKMHKLQHFATFEHGTVYLLVNEDSNPNITKWKEVVDFYKCNPYSKVKYYDWAYYITTNYRVICENHREADMQYWEEPGAYHEKRHTVIFTCDIGVSREYNRHRVDSILEESTRYCNYAKHGKESLNVVVPVWLRENYSNVLNDYLNKDLKDYCYLVSDDREDEFKDIDYWMFANKCAEFCYGNLINECKWTPQQARTILPLDTKTTLAHTAFDSDWEHFFELRALGTTGAPHPSAKELAEPLMKFFKDNNYIN